MSDKAAFEANKGKTAQPKALEDIQTQLTANNQRLQDEANKYVSTGKTKQSYAVDNASIDAAVKPSNDKTSFNNVLSLLNTNTIKPVDEFSTPDVNVSDVGLLANDEGLKRVVARGQDPNYNEGMAAFDVRALHKTPGFNENVAALNNQQEALRNAANEKAGTLKKEVEDYGVSQLAGAQKSAKDYLGNRSSMLQSGNEDEARSYNAALSGMDLRGASEGDVKKAIDTAHANMLQQNRYADRFIDPNSVDAMNYLKKGSNLDASNFVSSDEAAQYNNIMALLGTGGESWSESIPHPDASKNYAFDASQYEDELRNKALSGYGQYESKTLSDIAAMKDAAQRKADEEDALYLASVGEQGSPDWLRNQAQQAYQGSDFYKDLNPSYDPSMIDPTQYSMAAPSQDLGWQNVLSEVDAAKMNELARTIGGQDNYQGTNYQRSSPYGFDKSRYLNDLKQKLSDTKYNAENKKEEQILAAMKRNASRAILPGSSKSQAKTEGDMARMVYRAPEIPIKKIEATAKKVEATAKKVEKILRQITGL